jgi:hypothetical protein
MNKLIIAIYIATSDLKGLTREKLWVVMYKTVTEIQRWIEIWVLIAFTILTMLEENP